MRTSPTETEIYGKCIQIDFPSNLPIFLFFFLAIGIFFWTQTDQECMNCTPAGHSQALHIGPQMLQDAIIGRIPRCPRPRNANQLTMPPLAPMHRNIRPVHNFLKFFITLSYLLNNSTIHCSINMRTCRCQRTMLMWIKELHLEQNCFATILWHLVAEDLNLSKLRSFR